MNGERADKQRGLHKFLRTALEENNCLGTLIRKIIGVLKLNSTNGIYARLHCHDEPTLCYNRYNLFLPKRLYLLYSYLI